MLLSAWKHLECNPMMVNLFQECAPNLKYVLGISWEKFQAAHAVGLLDTMSCTDIVSSRSTLFE